MTEAAYAVVRSVEQALDLAQSHPGDYHYSAGGTDLQVRIKQELTRARVIIDLSEVPELRGIHSGPAGLVAGSMTTLRELGSSPEVRDWCPMIAEAAASVATPVVRMTATLGGNLLVANRCSYYNQSAEWRLSAGYCLRDDGDTCLVTGGHDRCFSRHVSDLAPALIALGARVVIHDLRSTREMPLEDLYVPDGLRSHAGLGDSAILLSVRIGRRPGRWWYRKLRRRESIDYSSLTVAGARDAVGGLRVSLGGVSMSPVLLFTEGGAGNLEDLKRQARRACKTVDNDLMSLSYRREMIDVFLGELWHSLDGASE